MCIASKGKDEQEGLETILNGVPSLINAKQENEKKTTWEREISNRGAVDFAISGRASEDQPRLDRSTNGLLEERLS